MDELQIALDKFKPHECECCGWKMYLISDEAKRTIYLRFLEVGTIFCTECIKQMDYQIGYVPEDAE